MLLPSLLLAGLLIVSSTTPATQTPATPSAAPSSTTTASPAEPPFAFEVSSIRQSHLGTSGSNSNMDHGRFIATNTTLKNLMQYSAFNLPEPRILGGPKWLNSTRFDIDAKLDADTLDRWNHLDRPQRHLAMQAIFQQLLADRFHLRDHWETRTLPIYALVVAKNGPHLHPSADAGRNTGTDTGSGEINAKGVTLDDLAQTLTQELSQVLGRVVVDRTDLPGTFDLTLKWSPDTDDPASHYLNGAATTSDTGPSLFTALQEQLGLKLEPARGPVRVLVIDQLDLPAEN